MIKTSVDYIIVGQGLAGSAVAIQLIKSGKKILVIDEPDKNISSIIAAGLFNPVTGKKLVKTWLADKLFPALHSFYREAEALTGQTFFYPTPIYRPVPSIEEQNEWMGKSIDEAYQDYVTNVFTSSQFSEVKDPFGGIMLKQCGYVNTGNYMRAVRGLTEQKGFFLNERFDDDQLRVTESEISYKTFTASKIIFCQGVHSLQNKYFNWLPVRPLKGETLSIKFDWQKDFILNRGVYIVREGDSAAFKIGSTYNINDSHPATTQEARVEMIDKLDHLVNIPYEVTGQQWGMRPTSPDRRPMLGQHPEFKNLLVFNGLGTKGVSLAPYFSEVLIHWLEKGGTIDKAVDVSRYKSLY